MDYKITDQVQVTKQRQTVIMIDNQFCDKYAYSDSLQNWSYCDKLWLKVDLSFGSDSIILTQVIGNKITHVLRLAK